MRIAAIGDSDMITGFGLIGVKELYEVTPDKTEIEKVFKEVASNKEIGIIIISSLLADFVRDQIKRTNETKKIIPVIIEIPDKSGVSEHDPFEELIKKAVGVSI